MTEQPWLEWAERWAPTRAAKPSVVTVDVHNHIFVPASAELVRPHFTPDKDPRTFFSAEETKRYNLEYYEVAHRKYTDPDERLVDMDAAGIDIQAVALGPSQYFYWPDEDLATRVAVMQNDRIAEVVAHSPARFVGLGTLPMAHPGDAVTELERINRDLGFKGIEIGADVNGADLDDPRSDPVWCTLEELGMLVVLHPAGFTEGRRLTDYYLVNVIGMPLASTVAVSRMILGGVFHRHPDLKMLVVHGGGYLPFYSARTDHAYRHRPELRRHIDRLPSEYLSRLYFDTTVFDPAMLEHLVRTFGADHVLLGTDYPYDMGLPDPLALIEDAQLTDPERELIVGGNAVRLFRIET